MVALPPSESLPNHVGRTDRGMYVLCAEAGLLQGNIFYTLSLELSSELIMK